LIKFNYLIITIDGTSLHYKFMLSDKRLNECCTVNDHINIKKNVKKFYLKNEFFLLESLHIKHQSKEINQQNDFVNLVMYLSDVCACYLSKFIALFN
jgi:hypothetical protein